MDARSKSGWSPRGLPLTLASTLALSGCSFVFDSSAGHSDAGLEESDAAGGMDGNALLQTLTIEAELGVFTNGGQQWTVGADEEAFPDYSGNGYLVTNLQQGYFKCDETADLDLCGARSSYTIEVAMAGQYHFHLRSWVQSRGTDSVYYGVDGDPVVNASNSEAESVVLSCEGWRWSESPQPIRFDSPGTHTIDLWIRERGARVDQILITRNSTMPEPPFLECPPET